MDDAALADALRVAFPDIITLPHEDGLILDTQNRVTQQQVLDHVNRQGWIIHHYGLYTPSLNDIFIAKVGEQA